MKTKQTILKAFASLALAMGAFASADAQTNLGSGCQCPAATTAARPIQNISEWIPFGYVGIAGTYGGELTGTNANLILTCDKTWVLDKKIYIPTGKTLTIVPGALIKGAANLITQPANATALIIERGGKIDAQGTKACPIVFTAFDDPMDGTYPITNIGKWGGVVILGKATNNLTLAANGPFIPGGAGKLAVADGLGTVEGFASSNPQDQYGIATSIPNAYQIGSSPALSGPQNDQNTYEFDLAVTFTSNTGTAPNVFGRFTVPQAVGSFVLNGMTVTGTGVGTNGTAVVTNIGSASNSLQTVTLNLANTTVSGAATLHFKGTYPLAANTSGYFFAQTYPTDGATPPASLVLNATGPIINGINYSTPFLGTVGGTFDDNDNSGTMKYVSIRHSGAILAVGAEINGLTLASVGRGTTIENIEIVACADDNVEIFGGTVNLKYITTIFGNDDMLDYDLGWTGKCQFFFGMNATSASSPDSDNGIEADADDNTSNLFPRSHPIIRNATFIGRNKLTATSDNGPMAAITSKELAEGEIYTSIFANFGRGLSLVKTLSGTRTLANGGNTWHNWTSGASGASNGTPQSFKVKCNTFVGVTTPLAMGTTIVVTTDTDYLQFNGSGADNNTVVASLPGFSYGFAINPATNAVTVKNDVTPFPAIASTGTGCPTGTDSFFTTTTYRGAFSSVIGENWLSDWSYSQLLGTITTLGAAGSCPTDLNGDGYINVTDFNLFAPTFGNTCN